MSLSKTFIKSKNKYKVTFTLPVEASPEAGEVKILGEFNDWSWDNAPTLEKQKKNYKVALELEPGKSYEYRYLVDNAYWVNDAIADHYVPSPFIDAENCVVTLDAPATNGTAKAKKAAPKKATAKKAAPKKTAKAEKFDLTKIEGIGPKLAGILVEAGYDSYQKVASEESSKIAEILVAANKRYKMHDPTTWPLQADLLAAGKMEELKKLQDELKGGRKA